MESMTERLLDALKAIDLSLNDKKTQIIRYNASEDDASLNCFELDDEFVKVSNDTDYHRYLGKLLCTSATGRVITGFRNRKRTAWETFANHKAIYLDHNILC